METQLAHTTQAPVSPAQHDLALVRRASGGDEAAFTELYDRHRRRTQALCRRMLQDFADVEELQQEVWMRVYSKMQGFRGESEFATWLHRLTVNRVLMHLRKERNRKERVAAADTMPDKAVSGTGNLGVKYTLVLGESVRAGESIRNIERFRLT